MITETEKPLLVLKIGSSSITKDNGELDEPVMVEVARQVAQLHKNYRILIVSSGAVGTGRRFVKGFDGSITDRKAAAAIGNPILVNKYAQFFSPYDIPIAQSLCERRHFSDRKAFLQLRETFENLWSHGVIPIANENDVVSDLEIKFSDNDELATLLAAGFEASKLLLATAVPGVLNKDGQVVPKIQCVDDDILGLAFKKKSSLGLGGMTSKLTFARLATRMGIEVTIFGLQVPNSIIEAVAGNTGTICIAQDSTLTAREKWLASGSIVVGRVQISSQTKEAIKNNQNLLLVGIRAILGHFSQGEVFEIVGENREVFAVAAASISSKNIDSKDGDTIVAKTNDIVLL